MIFHPVESELPFTLRKISTNFAGYGGELSMNNFAVGLHIDPSNKVFGPT